MADESLHKAVNDILRKYAARGKLTSREGSLTGVECMVNEEDGVILYRFVTWDDIEVGSKLVREELFADPHGYLERWEQSIIDHIDGYRRKLLLGARL